MEPQNRAGLAPDLFAGAGLGLLLGAVMGLSITPVVAGVVGALTSLLAIFLGLETKPETRRLPAVNAVRIGAFGFATVIGIGLGLFVRINNPLALDPAIVMAKWTAAFPENPTLARQMMVYERAALRPDAVVYTEGVRGTAVQQNAQAGAGKTAVLFSNKLTAFDACSQLNPERLSTTDATLRVYARPNAPEIVRIIGAEIGTLPEPELATGLRIAHDILCEMQISEGKLPISEASR